LESVIGGPEGLLLQVKLYLAGAVADLGEARLAHDALEHQPATDFDARRVGLEPLRIALTERGVQLSGERVAAEVIGEGAAGRAAGRRTSIAEAVRAPACACAQFRELRAPLGDQLVLIDARGGGATATGVLLVLHAPIRFSAPATHPP